MKTTILRHTGLLGYSVRKEEGELIPYLINPNDDIANISFYDPVTNLFVLCHRNAETQELRIIDSGYPADEFSMALKDSHDGESDPKVRIKVEELGVGDKEGISEEKTIHSIATHILEYSPIIGIKYQGYDESLNKYIYKGQLKNKRVFQIQAFLIGRNDIQMQDVEFSNDKVSIDSIPFRIYWFQPEDSDEARFNKLMEIYYSRIIILELKEQL